MVAAQRDASGNAVPDTSTVLEEGYPGQNLTLTIDASLQVAVEQELLSAWIADRAKRVSAVVMDPYTGEVFAYASYPSYDANDYQAIAAEDPGVFVDPIVSTVYEPGSVFKMMTAAAALGDGTVTTKTKIKDTGTLRLDGGRARVDDADRKAMGMMTFEDAIAYSRNVVAAKVALRLGKTTEGLERPAVRRRGARWASASRPGSTSPTRSAARPRPGVTPWRQIDLANGAFGQGVAVTPIQLAQAFAAMLNGGVLVQPRVVKAVGDRETAPDRARPGHVREALGDAHQADEPRHHRGGLLPRPDADPGLRGRRQDRHGPDLGRREEGAGRSTCSTTRSSATSRASPAGRTSWSPSGSRRARRPWSRRGHLEMPVMSFELFRRIAHNAINTPDLVPETSTRPPRRRRPPRDRACATLDAVTDPGRPLRPRTRPDRRRPRSQRPAAGCSVAATARSAAAAVDSRLVAPGNLFVALPGERTDGHRFLAAAVAAGAAALLVVARPGPRRGRAGPRRRWAT